MYLVNSFFACDPHVGLVCQRLVCITLCLLNLGAWTTVSFQTSCLQVFDDELKTYSSLSSPDWGQPRGLVEAGQSYSHSPRARGWGQVKLQEQGRGRSRCPRPAACPEGPTRGVGEHGEWGPVQLAAATCFCLGGVCWGQVKPQELSSLS